MSGRVDVDQMLTEIPARLFNEWLAYYRVEPFGEERADLRIAQLTAVTANAHRKKSAKPFKIQDFLLKFKRQRRKQWQEILSMVESMNKAFGGEDKRSEEQKGWRKK